MKTAYLPKGWEMRVINVSPPGHSEITGLCLVPHVLSAAKLARNDQKDREFVSALVRAGLVSAVLVGERISAISDQRFLPVQKEAALSFIRSLGN